VVHEQFRRALEGPEPIFGAMATWDSFGAVETLAELSPDFLIIDCQHSFISERESQRLLYASHNPKLATLVRVSSHDPTQIGFVLDAGADAVIVPMVENAAQAHAAVGACRHPPAGVRSFGPNRRSMKLSADTPAFLDSRASCFVMVETAEGLRNLSEICAVPGLAGLYIGPADLGISMGIPILTYPVPQGILEALRLIREECSKAGIIAGIQGGFNRTLELATDGFQLITIGIDWVYLAQGLQADIDLVRDYLQKRKEMRPSHG
jgi:4-hydroxy-2-oxoheptanedioate aldolase